MANATVNVPTPQNITSTQSRWNVLCAINGFFPEHFPFGVLRLPDAVGSQNNDLPFRKSFFPVCYIVPFAVYAQRQPRPGQVLEKTPRGVIEDSRVRRFPADSEAESGARSKYERCRPRPPVCPREGFGPL